MYSISELALRLSSVKHFHHIHHDELEKIILLGQVQVYHAGEVVFQEDTPGEGLFVLLAGQIQLCKLSRQGQNAILAIFEPVIMFNEVAALDRGRNPVTAISMVETVVWRLSAEALEQLVLRYPQVGLGLLRVLATRNRHLVAQYEDITFRSVMARAAKLLLELSGHGNKTIDRRKHPVHQMAAQIATVPEAFSRSLKVFRENEDIRCAGPVIQVIDVGHLEEIADIGPRAF
jgi:CRP-like cAMP-binding protein